MCCYSLICLFSFIYSINPPPISFILLFNIFIEDRSSPTSEFRVTNWDINIGASFLCIFSILRGNKISGLTFELLLWRSNEASFFVVAVQKYIFACPADSYIIIYLCYDIVKLSKTLLTHVFRKMKAQWITHHPKASKLDFDMKGIF